MELHRLNDENVHAELEAELLRVDGIDAVRLVAGPGTRIAEVHVVTSGTRGPKQVVRDVQSVALARFGVELDYRTVSVVQLQDVADQLPNSQHVAPAPRPGLVGVNVTIAGPRADADVNLRIDGRDRLGSARGPSGNVLKLVAEATLAALEARLFPALGEIERVDFLNELGARSAVVVVRVSDQAEARLFVGAALVRTDPYHAVARAVLDALNRLRVAADLSMPR